MFRGPPPSSANDPVRPRQLVPDRPPLSDLPVLERPPGRPGRAGQTLTHVGGCREPVPAITYLVNGMGSGRFEAMVRFFGISGQIFSG